MQECVVRDVSRPLGNWEGRITDAGKYYPNAQARIPTMIETEGPCEEVDTFSGEGQIGREKHDRTSIFCWCDFLFV